MKGKATDKETVARLLEKFMAGDTTLAEERLLADYFACGDVPAEWEAYRVMFGYFADGMPGVGCRRKPRRTPLRALAAAALACAALVLLLLQPWAGRMAEPVAPPVKMAGLAIETSAGRPHGGSAVADSLPAAPADTLGQRRAVGRPVKRLRRCVRQDVAPPKPLLAADEAAMRRADSLAEVELHEIARQQALALELMEALGEVQAEAADRLLAAEGDDGTEEEVYY